MGAARTIVDDPGRAKIEVGQHFALERFAQVPAKLLRIELRVLQGDDHQLRHGLRPISGRVADFGHTVDVALLQLLVDLFQKLRCGRLAGKLLPTELAEHHDQQVDAEDRQPQLGEVNALAGVNDHVGDVHGSISPESRTET